VVSWSLEDLSKAVIKRSSTDTSAVEREEIDGRIRTGMDLLRSLLPANHWYVQLAYRVVRGGMLSDVILQAYAKENPDALLPSADVIAASKNDVAIADDIIKEDGSQLTTRQGTREEARKMALFEPIKWFKTFSVVNSEETYTDDRGLVKKRIKPFDLTNNDPRSRYQLKCYGPFLERWANDDPHVPKTKIYVRKGRIVKKTYLKTNKHYIARMKPRKVGSTTFGKKFSVLCGANIDNWSTLLHFPGKEDAKAHLRDIAEDLRHLHENWPHIYPPLVQENYTEGRLVLANGSKWEIRYSDAVGVIKVGHTGFNLVILSEAGKYERKAGAQAWDDINQAILPAVYPSTRNVILWEGTNDAQAAEINRIALLDYVDFQFFGASELHSNVGRAISPDEQESTPAGRYADFEIDDSGEPKSIPERDYIAKLKLTPEQCGFRRRKIDELGELMLVHMEYPYTYAESLGLVSGGFFMRVQPSRTPDNIGELRWAEVTAVEPTVWTPVEFVPTLRGEWHMWDLPTLPEGEDPYYAVASDFADGLPDSDYAPIGVARVNDGRLCACRRSRLDPTSSADELAKAVSYFGVSRTYVIGELNNPGKLAVNRWETYGHGLNYTQYRKPRGYTEELEMIWFLTSPKSRDPILIALRKAYHLDQLLIPDERFEWDAEGFVKSKTGKYEAQAVKSPRTGERYMDDYIMMAAMLWELIQWMRERGMGREIQADKESVMPSTLLGTLSPNIQKIIRKSSERR